MVMLPMLSIQLIWMSKNYLKLKSTLTENMFWPQDVVQVDLSKDSDFHHVLVSKKEESLKELLSNLFWPWRMILLVIISHFTDLLHMKAGLHGRPVLKELSTGPRLGLQDLDSKW